MKVLHELFVLIDRVHLLLAVFRIFLYRPYEPCEIVCEQVPAEEVAIAFVAELLDFVHFLRGHAELGGVALGQEEHAIVLLPVLMKVRVVHYDQIDSVQVGQYGPQVVEYLEVAIGLLEKFHVDLCLSLIEAVHLVDYVLCQCHYLLDCLK